MSVLKIAISQICIDHMGVFDELKKDFGAYFDCDPKSTEAAIPLVFEDIELEGVLDEK